MKGGDPYQQKQAVLAVLAPHFSQQQCADALTLWESGSAVVDPGNPPSSFTNIVAFLRRFCEQQNITDQSLKSTIRKGLFRTLMLEQHV